MAEAQRVLRMGRTKMYELLGEWRDTGGASGLRVIELGNALRVPRVALEELIGAPIHVPPAPPGIPVSEPVAAPTLVLASTNDTPEPAPPPRQRPSRRPDPVPVAQLDLFDAPTAS